MTFNQNKTIKTQNEDNIEKQNEKTNTKRQVNKHSTNNQNITQRKKQPQKIQHKTNKEQYWIDNLPPELTEKDFPTLTTNNTQQNSNRKEKQPQGTTTIMQKQPSQGITIIKETLISQQPQNEDNEVDFLSPPAIPKPHKTITPDPIDSSTPNFNTIQTKQNTNKEIFTPTLYKKRKIIEQETIQDKALKMTQKLAKLNYRDTGFLSNATTGEREKIIALWMYYQIGRFDPSNQFIRTYRNKNIISMVKQYTIEKLHKKNALTNIFMYIYAIEERMEKKNINNDNVKNKNNHKK